MEFLEKAQNQRLMICCKNTFFSAAKTNPAAAANAAISPPVQGDIAAAACSTVKTGDTAPKMRREHPLAPRKYWPLLEDMPGLNHWPERNQPFEYANSEVTAFIMARCGVSQKTAARIFDSANKKGVIKFNRDTSLWCGVKGGAA